MLPLPSDGAEYDRRDGHSEEVPGFVTGPLLVPVCIVAVPLMVSMIASLFGVESAPAWVYLILGAAGFAIGVLGRHSLENEVGGEGSA